MKNLIITLSCLLLIGFANLAYAQSNEWSLPFDKKPKWTSVDFQTNTIFYYDGKKVNSFDYVDQKTNWSIPLPSYTGANYSYSMSSPHLTLYEPKKYTMHNKYSKAVVVDRQSGEIQFNSFDCEEFDQSQVRISTDKDYVLLVRVEKIKKDKKKGIKKHINEYLSLVKLGSSEALWTVQLPKDGISRTGLARKMRQEKDFKLWPLANSQVVIFSYGPSLYAYNIKDGSIRWQKNIKEGGIRFISKVQNDRSQEGFLMSTKDKDGTFELNLYSFEKGEPLWTKAVDLGIWYNYKRGPASIMIRSSLGFNYVDYDGNLRWPEYVKTKWNIETVYQQKNGFLLLLKNKVKNGSTEYGINWLDRNQQLAFSEPQVINDHKFRKGINLDGYLVLITKDQIYTFDTQKGMAIAQVRMVPNADFSIDKDTKNIVYTNYITALQLSQGATTPEVLSRPKFKSKKDTIWRVEAFQDGYTLVSKREAYKYDWQHQEMVHLYFKKPMQIGKKLVKLGGNIAMIAIGYTFKDEIAELNRAAYEEGLIDENTYFNNALNMYGYGGLGAAAAVAGGVDDVKKEFSNSDKSKKASENLATYNKMKQLWILKDKVDEGGWGLRVIDTKTCKELNQIKLGNKEKFDFLIDERTGILISQKKDGILFYDLMGEL